MFIYMSKKIAIPKHTGVSCLAWNQTAGFIAVGGDDGMLKVLKLESGGGGNLSMNLSLEGHSGRLQVATWNEVHQKLTTSDQHGVIIVWMLYKGSWYEEMINNRNKSTVRGMAWSSDGEKICIAYEDGAVIVGSVDGSRVWGKDIKGPGLSAVQWSPDNTLLLFALSTGELHIYDNQGNFAISIPIQCTSMPAEVIGLDWYSGPASSERPVLAICFKNGRLQLMKTHNDEDVIVADSGLTAVACHWNHNGTIIAIAGTLNDDSNAVQFFNAFGEHLRILRVPGGSMQSFAWEGRSLRIAIAVDSFIYFANVKPDHKRAFFGNTLAFCSGPNTVTFWDMITNQTWVNHIPGVVDMCGVDEYCVIASDHTLIISNQQGIQCDAKISPFDVFFVGMNSKGSVIAASKDCFMLWKFVTPSRSATKEQILNADGSPYTDEVFSNQDPICCICCSDTLLLIGKESGVISSFTLPQLTSGPSYNLSNRPYKLALNSNSSKFSMIDSTSSLYIVDIEMSTNIGANTSLRRDVWGVMWASDNPQLLAVAEKARLYVFRGMEPEEPLTAQGYLCKFQDLEILSVLLDDIAEKCTSEYVIKLEVKSLRDTRQLLEKVGLKEAETFIQDNPHPRLWQLLAEAALKHLCVNGDKKNSDPKVNESSTDNIQASLDAAEAAFVRRTDYAGIRFVRRLTGLHSDALRRAEVAAYFADFDSAEKTYLEEDRRDLAIQLRQRLGHWFRVVELLKMSTNTSEAQITEAYGNIGDYYIDRQNWHNAKEYYTMANNVEGLKKCYMALEDNEALSTLVATTPRKMNKDTKQGYNTNVDVSESQEPSIALALQLKEGSRFPQAAVMLCQLAKLEAAKGKSPIFIQKLYVLAGHLYSQGSVEGVGGRSASLCWKLASAQRWLALCSLGARALVGNSIGSSRSALPAAACLQQLAMLLPKEQQRQAWAAIALVSAHARSFGMCSQAFVKLEALEDGDVYQKLAVDIFSKHPPKDPKPSKADCHNCHSSISEWSTSCPSCYAEFVVCSVSGRIVRTGTRGGSAGGGDGGPVGGVIWACTICGAQAARQEIVLRQSCPICHSPIQT